MYYSETTSKAYLFAGKPAEKIAENELSYANRSAAYSALVYSEAKGNLLMKARAIFLELPSSKEPDYKAIDAFLKELATIQSLEPGYAATLQAKVNEVNNPLPGANFEYYEHLATLSDAK